MIDENQTHLFSFVLPVSTTKTTSGIVIPVSAILVAKTIWKEVTYINKKIMECLSNSFHLFNQYYRVSLVEAFYPCFLKQFVRALKTTQLGKRFSLLQLLRNQELRDNFLFTFSFKIHQNTS